MINVCLEYDDLTPDLYEISVETAEKLQAFYNVDQFEHTVVAEGFRLPSYREDHNTCYLDMKGRQDDIEKFLDDLATELALVV